MSDLTENGIPDPASETADPTNGTDPSPDETALPPGLQQLAWALQNGFETPTRIGADLPGYALSSGVSEEELDFFLRFLAPTYLPTPTPTPITGNGGQPDKPTLAGVAAEPADLVDPGPPELPPEAQFAELLTEAGKRLAELKTTVNREEVWGLVDDLALLPPSEYGPTKQELKERLGRGVSWVDFEAAVEERRKQIKAKWEPPKPPPIEVSPVTVRLREDFQPLGFLPGELSRKLYLWNRRKRRTEWVPMSKPRDFANLVAIAYGNPRHFVKAVTGGELPSLRKALETLEEALFELSQDAEDLGQFKPLGNGVHLVDVEGQPCPVIVKGQAPIIREGEKWQEQEWPIWEGYRVERGSEWAPWLTPEALNSPPVRPLGEIRQHLENVLAIGWKFADSSDPLLLSLLTLYGPVAYLWPRKIYLHVQGHSQTGKTALVEFLRFWWPHADLIVDASEAGLVAKYGQTAQPLLQEEAELSTNRHLRALLTALRGADEKGATKLRGLREGGFREVVYHFPFCLFSIEPIDSGEADANRFLTVHTVPEPGREEPARAIARYWQEEGIDPQEIRADLWRYLLNGLPELRRVTEEVRREMILPPGTTTRFMGQFWPLLALAKVAGHDPQQIADRIVTEKLSQIQDVASLNPGERLLEYLLSRPFSVNPTYTAAGLANFCADHSEEGFVTELKEGKRLLFVRFATAQTNALRGTEFEHMGGRALRSRAEGCQSYRGVFRGWKGRINDRWQIFELPNREEEEN